jgi:hypothetical protein
MELFEDVMNTFELERSLMVNDWNNDDGHGDEFELVERQNINFVIKMIFVEFVCKVHDVIEN